MSGPPKLGRNALAVLRRRYLVRDERGHVTERPAQLFERVAHAIAEGDRRHEGEAEARVMERRYARAMRQLLFLPNSPTLMNAGTAPGQLAACFVLPVEDDLGSIFGAVRDAALIHQTGGGTGFSFSRLRPWGDPVGEVGGVASGPVSFMRVFDTATDVIKQGGRRRGANMAVLSISHPDIEAFATVKTVPGVLSNFNLSVSVPDAFLAAVEQGARWPLVNPRDGRVHQRIPARALWRTIARAAWTCGDPGVLFEDAIERANPTPSLGRLEATNPCGEQPLLPYEACTLGSINLARLVRGGAFDWEMLDDLARLGVRFLDNVVEVNRTPLPEIDAITRANRKIGLGVMGFAEALIRLGIGYASEEAAAFAARLFARIEHTARSASAELAGRRGAFPNCAASVWPGRGFPLMRHATLTTIAPTGTLSILAGTTSGIEPLFGLAYLRTALGGTELPEVHPAFVAELERRRLPVRRIVRAVMETGTLAGVRGIPPPMRRLFVTAHDVPLEWHVRLQAETQKHVDNAVSKTVNLPPRATVEAVERAFTLAWRSGCKGATVFRDGCRGAQVLHFGRIPAFAVRDSIARAHAEYAGECRLCSV